MRIFDDDAGREAFLEYLRNLSPQIFLLTAGVFFYHLGVKDTSCTQYLFKSLAALAGIVAIFSAFASAIQFYRAYVGTAGKNLALSIVFVIVYSCVGLTYLMAALSAERLLR